MFGSHNAQGFFTGGQENTKIISFPKIYLLTLGSIKLGLVTFKCRAEMSARII